MLSIKYSSRWNICLASIIVLIIFGLMIAGVGFAAPPSTPIKTDDGLIDPQWGAPIYSSTINNLDITDTIEIKNAWLMSDANQLYFRIQTYSPAALLSGYGAVAAIDCDQDGLTNTRADRLIAWEVSNDALTYRYGDTLKSVGQYCIIGFPCPYGERLNDPYHDNVEWRGDYSVIPLDAESFPADCRDAINISLAIVNMTTTTVSSNSPLIAWNVPTNIDMKEIKIVRQTSVTPLALGVTALILAICLGVVVTYRQRRGLTK